MNEYTVAQHDPPILQIWKERIINNGEATVQNRCETNENWISGKFCSFVHILFTEEMVPLA